MAGSERQMTSKLHLPPPTIIMAIGLLVSIQDGVLATIFLSASGFAILIFEWLHLFKDETRLIWKQPFTPSKLVFLYLRYGVLVTHAFLSYGISGIPETISEKYCRAWLIVMFVGGAVTLLTANLVSLQRFYITWDHRPRIIRILNGALAFSFLASFGCCIASLAELYHDIEPDNDVYHVCLISHKPSAWVGIWVPQVAFQVFTIGLTLFNAGERPRTSNAQILRQLQIDGAVYFIALFCLRLANLVFALIPNPAYIITVVLFDWAIISVTVGRLLLRMEDLMLPRHERAYGLSTEDREQLRRGTPQDGSATVSLNLL